MSTSSNAYAVTQEAQKEGSYTLGAVATESISSDEGSDAHKDESAEDETNWNLQQIKCRIPAAQHHNLPSNEKEVEYHRTGAKRQPCYRRGRIGNCADRRRA